MTLDSWISLTAPVSTMFLTWNLLTALSYMIKARGGELIAPVYAHIPGKRNGRRSDSSRQIGRIKRGMTYLGGAPVAVVAPDGLSVAAAVEGASVIPSLSGHDGRRGGRDAR
jgi:hypothetical protein